MTGTTKKPGVTATPRTGADSARRALDVLFAFSEQRPILTVRQVSEILSIPLPSVHRYMALLRDTGLVEDAARGQYHLSMRVAALARAARRAAPLIDIAEPHMRALSEQTGESVLLMRLVHGAPVCFHRVESSSRFRLSFEPGQLLPALRGASVRLLLGGLGPADRQRYLEDALAAGATPPLNGVEHYLDEVARDVARGWAISNEEIDEGVWAPAAAVYEDGTVVASLSIPCPSFRVDDDRRAQLLEMVRRAAAALTAALGG